MRRTVLLILLLSSVIFAQNTKTPQMQSRDVDDDGIPVLTKNLPDWQNAKNRSTYILNKEQLKTALGNDKPVLDLIDFTGGNEAVTANYDQGKLLIVEFNTPQTSVEADNKINAFLTENPPNPPIFYRRIGNYNVFIFDGKDETMANTLFDQIKYGKVVQWLGEDPYYIQKAERYIARTTSEVFISTFLAVSLGILASISVGAFCGYLFFRHRAKRQAKLNAFSDAGGMIRLNLDELSADDSERLLNK